MANPVGEDNWLAYTEEAVRNATDLEQRVNVIELYKRAASNERGSLPIWLAYCDFFWSLWSDSQSEEAGWSEDERLLAQELFTFDAALDVWQQGYEAVKGRLHDSHLLWNRWISLEIELLNKTKTADGIKRITQLYRDRLATPHLTWDDTSQMYSGFLSEHNQSAWEQSMKEATSSARKAKVLIDQREPFEIKLKQAERSDNADAPKSVMTEYLEWEMTQRAKIKKPHPDDIDLCTGLYNRALTGIFAKDENIWQNYIVYLSSSPSSPGKLEDLLDTLRRAVQHCPWSGQLWNRYILCAEEAGLPFAEIENIKHTATSDDQLYKNGMEGLIDMYVAWCGFLKRTAMGALVTDEAVDVADVGLAAALEDVAVVGRRLYGKDFQGDPKFRLERIHIQYLTERKGALDDARRQWTKLAKIHMHADNHDFWLRYYFWEMLVFSSTSAQPNGTASSAAPGHSLRTPTKATAVLSRATARRTMDWPEKIFEVYLQHCNDHETPSAVRTAADEVYKAQQTVRARREREQKEAAAYAAYYGTQGTEGATAAESQGAPESAAEQATPGGSKRKRELVSEADVATDSASKRQKNETDDQENKRDRENATVLITNIPEDATQTKLKQYFKGYGHINNITAMVKDDDGKSFTALIEFRSPEDAQSARLRDGKYFGQSQLSVQSGFDLTVYLANFPPSAGEDFIRDLFSDCGRLLSIRWPSLKVNTHRRFCYVSFADRDASAKAVLKDGSLLEGRFKLIAKYSDPGHKKRREGAVAEGREVHITNLDKVVTEAELRDVFSKLGTVTRVNIPQSMAGHNRGFAFLDFETKDQAAKAAEEMNNVKLRHQIVRVEVSTESKVKPSAKTFGVSRESQSPAPGQKDAEGDEKMGQDNAGEASGKPKPPSAAEVDARTIALMGLPDTVNDTRVRALVDPLGPVVKLSVRPSHGGARIEFADAAAAGKAGMALNGMVFEGVTLRTGSLEELRHAKAERRPGEGDEEKQPKQGGGGGSGGSTEQKAAGSGSAAGSGAPRGYMMPAPVRRPILKKPVQKRGPKVGSSAPAAGGAAATSAASGTAQQGGKSNADFKAMFLASGKKDDEGGKVEEAKKEEEKKEEKKGGDE